MGEWVPYNIRWVLGLVFFICSLPLLGPTGMASVVWHFADPVSPRLRKLFCKAMHPLGATLTRREEDSFFLPCLLLQGVVVPCFFFFALWQTITFGMSWKLAFAYHVLRIGPYFQNFAYAYTLCHKEGHTKVGMFKKEYMPVLGSAWNWWIGVFYGVMPLTFAYGHSVNHHRYDNDEHDTVSSWDQPRDNFNHYLAYLPRWLAYHWNVSVFIQFCIEGNRALATWMVMGTGAYVSVLSLFLWVHPLFTVIYFLYPLVEASLLLSAINWAWHCFVDPDAENIYASSVTLFESDESTNVLNEDYHVVHHQYPGAHWTDHPRLYDKHKEEYVKNMATCFRKTHAMELFGLTVARQYGILAGKFIDLSNTLTLEQKEELIKTRLRTCTWGVNANTIQAKAQQMNASTGANGVAGKKED